MHPKQFQELNMSSKKNEFDKCCNFLNNLLLNRKFILDDEVSYADIIILGSLTWGDKVSKNTKINEKFVKLIEWKENLSQICT
jgi:glutathione S-transferase